MHIFVPGFANGGGQSFSGDAGDRGFAGCVNIRNDQQVRQIEGQREIIPKLLTARIAVRLEKHQEAIKLADFGGFQGGADFYWVMAVVIDHRDVVDDAFDVEAAADAGEFAEGFAN